MTYFGLHCIFEIMKSFSDSINAMAGFNIMSHLCLLFKFRIGITCLSFKNVLFVFSIFLDLVSLDKSIKKTLKPVFCKTLYK